MEIIISFITLILLVMQMSNIRVKKFLQWFLSAISSGLIYYHLVGHFNIWDKNDFDNWQNSLPQYLESSRFGFGVIIMVGVYFFLYILLDILFKQLLKKRLERYFSEYFKNLPEEKKVNYVKAMIIGLKFGIDMRRNFPFGKSKPDSANTLEDDLSESFVNLVMFIHFVVCIWILKISFSWILFPFAIIFLFLFPIIIPLVNVIINLFEEGALSEEQLQEIRTSLEETFEEDKKD